MKKVQCLMCDGHYEIKHGKYGAFGGCSNYPKCTSKINFNQLIYSYFEENGFRIYRWDRECWKCSSQTGVYTYYLLYDLQLSYPFFDDFAGIGLGNVPSLDNYMCEVFKTISMSYSYTAQEYYVANHCQYCGALQGRNYVVDDPHEIIGDLIIEKNMEKYLYITIPFNYIKTNLSEFKDCFEGIRVFFLTEK